QHSPKVSAKRWAGHSAGPRKRQGVESRNTRGSPANLAKRARRETRMTLRQAGLAFALLLSAPAAAEPVRYTPVMDISKEWAGSWNVKNVKAVMALYAPEPVFHPTVGATWDGAPSIRRNFIALLKDFDPDITLHSVRSQTSGTLAYDSGTYSETIARVKG